MISEIFSDLIHECMHEAVRPLLTSEFERMVGFKLFPLHFIVSSSNFTIGIDPEWPCCRNWLDAPPKNELLTFDYTDFASLLARGFASLRFSSMHRQRFVFRYCYVFSRGISQWGMDEMVELRFHARGGKSTVLAFIALAEAFSQAGY